MVTWRSMISSQPTKLWSYFRVSFNNGRDVTGGLTAALGGVWDTTGDGVANLLNPGSDYNFAVGTITAFDLTQGAINHAVRVAIGPDALKSPGLTWTDNIPWPNTHEDYDGPKIYKGKIIAGSTFGIPIDVDLLKLNLSQGGLMLAKALQNYGAIWRDSGGEGSFIFYSIPEAEHNPLIQEMRMDLQKIMPHLNILRNQSSAAVNGGGRSVVPRLPPVGLTHHEIERRRLAAVEGGRRLDGSAWPRAREARYDGGCSARTLVGNARQIGFGCVLARGSIISGVHLRLYGRAASVSVARQPVVYARDRLRCTQ